MNIKNVKIETLVPYEKNAKAHPPKQVAQIAKSIQTFGWGQPIVVDKQNVIIVGHGRYEAAKALQLKDVPVITVDLTEEQAKAYRLADNKLNESDWDMKLVVEELKEMSEDMVDLTGFSIDLTLEADEKDDEVPDVPDEPTSKLGDIYQLGRHRIMCGDSTNADAVAKLMDGAKGDMVFTDPPYGVDYTGKTKEKLKIKNDLDTNVFKDSLPNYIASVKSGASFYVCCPAGNKFKDFFLPFEEYCHLSATIIWAKNSLVLGHGDYHYQHEPILYGWANNGTHIFFGDRSQTSLWSIDRPTRSKEHPTMKPVALVEKAIINSSKSDDIVLDLFLGGGEHTHSRGEDGACVLRHGARPQVLRRHHQTVGGIYRSNG